MNLISQSEAARLAGVSRQAISKMKGGLYNFFVGGKVDTHNPAWKEYLAEREQVKLNNVVLMNPKQMIDKNKKKTGKKSGKKKVIDGNKKIIVEKAQDDALLANEHPKQKDALTGGYPTDAFIATSPQQQKQLTEIVSKKIDMMVKLEELIPVEMVVSIMEIVVKDIRSFVNLSRKVSGLICQKLDCVGMEKTVEAIIDPVVENIVKMLKKNMNKAIDIRSYRE